MPNHATAFSSASSAASPLSVSPVPSEREGASQRLSVYLYCCLSRFLPIVMLGVCVLGGCGAQQTPEAPSVPPKPPVEPYVITLDGHRLTVEVAISDTERNRGLMHRDRLDENRGMLFVYDAEARLSFWMRNTFIPLSIAFIDRQCVVRDVRDMQPLDETGVTSRVPVLYALEANQGWFRKRGIRIGTQTTFSPALEALIEKHRQEE